MSSPYAAREAVLRGRASIFVYPLRALVADQAYHLSSTMAALGIGVGVLTGETVRSRLRFCVPQSAENFAFRYDNFNLGCNCKLVDFAVYTRPFHG